LKLGHRVLTDVDLSKYAKVLEIPYFRGVYMRNALLKRGPHKHEAAIVNLDDKSGSGTYSVAYRKNNDDVIYFDSFGNLQPPPDLMEYLGVGSVKYNHEQFQNYDQIVCGHLCLKFLSGQLYKNNDK